MLQQDKTKLVKAEIEKLLFKGETDLKEIYTKITDKYGVPRNSIRRIKRELLQELKYKVEILDQISNRKPIPKARPSNVNNLAPIEQRILEFLKDKGEVVKYRTIFDTLNFNTHYPPITKKRLTYYLGKLCAANLVKKLRESRYRIIIKEVKTIEYL